MSNFGLEPKWHTYEIKMKMKLKMKMRKTMMMMMMMMMPYHIITSMYSVSYSIAH